MSTRKYNRGKCKYEFCDNDIISDKKTRNYCSIACAGYARRGKGIKGNPQKNHIRIRVFDENGKPGREYLHRVVFQENVRPLQPGEIVHHKNEDKFCNEPENLEPLSGQDVHLHVHNYWRHKRRKAINEALNAPVQDFNEDDDIMPF